MSNEYVDLPNLSSQDIAMILTRQILQKVRLLGARLATSIGPVGREEPAYQRAQLQAMVLVDQGFHMGGLIRASRETNGTNDKNFVRERRSVDRMVRPERIELPTSWFVAMHSIQLSYGRILVNLRPRIIAETKSFRPTSIAAYANHCR